MKPVKSSGRQTPGDCSPSQKTPVFNASTPLAKFSTQAQICSPTFTNISAIKKKEEPPKDLRRMLAAPEDFDESFISLSKINNVSSNSEESPVTAPAVPEPRDKSRESLVTVTAPPLPETRDEPNIEKSITDNINKENGDVKVASDKESSDLKQVIQHFLIL